LLEPFFGSKLLLELFSQAHESSSRENDVKQPKALCHFQLGHPATTDAILPVAERSARRVYTRGDRGEASC